MANGTPALSPEDLRFLVEFRDYLNSAAYPASGSTIAFSTFVSDQAAGHRLGDARRTNPGFEPLARRLRNSILVLSAGALVVTVLVAFMGAYVYWGNAIVSSTVSALTERDNLAKDIAREEATGVTRLYTASDQPGMRNSLFLKQIAQITGNTVLVAAPSSLPSNDFVGLCDAIATFGYGSKSIQVFRSAPQEYLCNQYIDVNDQIVDFRTEAETWYGF